MNKEKRGVLCNFCDQKFASKWTLSRHVQNIHDRPRPNTEQNNRKSECSECLFQFSRFTKLTEHLKDVHGISLPIEEFNFASKEDFLAWKYDMQRETLSEYIKETSTKTLANGEKKIYLVCHRSNLRVSRVKNRQRSFKSQGSNKIGKCCPSRIEVAYHKDSTLSVKFWKTHCGHTNDLGHLLLDKPTKDHLARKLQDGVSFQHILDETREEGADIPKRTLLLERKDLHNVARDYNISYSTRCHAEDGMSVRLWVQEMNNLGEDSPVLFYKEQGEEHPVLHRDDFMLILMTNFQASQVLKFGNNKICIDGTHGTNGYDIQMITVMTVDEFGAGCPVAYCFSSKCDEEHMTLFFNKMKEKVGEVKATSFMSDDAPAFYNAWSNVMGVPENKLLCSWHVDRCWRKNLCKIKGGVKKKTVVYKTLKVLMQSLLSKEDFQKLLNTTVENLLSDDDTSGFGEYFLKMYVKRPEQWAYSFRLGLGINTNMYLESFHRTLKHIYLEGKKVKRLDKTINAAMKMARDSLFKRLIRLSKLTPTERIQRINKAHKDSEKIGPSDFAVIKEGEEWEVTSSNGKDKYLITKCNYLCEESCMTCFSCKICIHSFKCTCHDNVIKMNICKHIHACCNVFSLNCLHKSSIVNNEISLLVEQTQNPTTVAHSNQALSVKASTLLDLLNKTKIDDTSSRIIAKKVDDAISILNNLSSSSKFNSSKKVNVRQKIEPQVRLFSVKKKTKTCTRIKKPTSNESECIINGLQSNTQEVLHIHTGIDHTYGKTSNE